jgi:hypothetical protein
VTPLARAGCAPCPGQFSFPSAHGTS